MVSNPTSYLGAGIVGIVTAGILAVTDSSLVPPEAWAFAGESIITAGTTLGTYYVLERD